jgi:UDP-3-O-[3-hydroxymyristoyl] N-acetylglucosamine deacetylase
MTQQTLKAPVTLNGVGLHSGNATQLRLCPADENTGIIFIRTDLEDPKNIIPARWDHVIDTRLCTMIGNEHGATVGTIEHLMAALRGAGIDNLRIELNGPEVPIMDGSSVLFMDALTQAGIEQQDAPRRYIKILSPITVREGDKEITLTPDSVSLFSGEIDFAHPAIGNQTYETSLVNGNFAHFLADCRTFGFEKDVEMLRKNGLARGGSLDNAIVLGEDNVLNPDGLRHADEFIRHKLLDAVGDLYLAEAPILGKYHGIKAGHDMNNKILHALFAQPEEWTYVEMDSPSHILVHNKASAHHQSSRA